MQRLGETGLLAATQRDLAPFGLIVPQSVDEAVQALAAHADALPYAGGTDLCASILEGRKIGTLVWLSKIAALREIEATGDGLSFGALVTHAEGASASATQTIPGFAEAWAKIANVRIRWTATIGGNLMALRPRYEMSILLNALEARVRFRTRSDETVLNPADLWSGKAPAGSLLTGITVPAKRDLMLDYERSLRPIMTIALARWRDEAGTPRGRAVIATEYCVPVALTVDLAARAPAAEVAAAALEQLPANFADVATGNAYLRRAGAALLARQIDRTGGADG